MEEEFEERELKGRPSIDMAPRNSGAHDAAVTLLSRHLSRMLFVPGSVDDCFAGGVENSAIGVTFLHQKQLLACVPVQNAHLHPLPDQLGIAQICVT